MTAEHGRDPRVEAKFDEWNLPWKFVPDIPFADIRVADWAQVRAGENLAPKQRVTEFAEQMRNGAEYPGIVLMHGEPPVLFDGNTRLSAAILLGQTSMPAYIVETGTVDMAKALAGSLNNMNGERLTEDEACELAQLMSARGMDETSVARETGRTMPQVRKWRVLREGKAHAARLGVLALFESLTVSKQRELSRVVHDSPFAALVGFVAELKPRERDVRELVNQILVASSEAEEVGLIEEHRLALNPSGPPPHRPNLNHGYRYVRMFQGHLARYPDPVTLVDWAKPDESRTTLEAVRQAMDAALRLL